MGEQIYKIISYLFIIYIIIYIFRFAYIDNLKIGMFDFNRWCNVMKRYVMETNKFSNDSFLW